MKINKDQIFLSKFKEWKFNYYRAKGHIISYLKNRFIWYYYPRLRKVSKFPDHIDVEISSICDLKCPMCYTNLDEFKNNVNRTLMDINLFKKIIDEAVQYNTYSIRLSLRGEAFLHPEIIEMIKYAKAQGIKEVSTLTNNNRLNPEIFEKVLKVGLDWLTISFDGIGAIYEKIRYPIKFKESYNKIKEYYKIKQKYRSVKPVIKVQTVWPAIKENPGKYYELFEPYVDSIASNTLVDYLHKDTEIEYQPNFECPVLYQRLVIGADGIVLLCSNDEFGYYPLGDANNESIYSIWHGDNIQKARKYHKQHIGVKKIKPCKYCYLPRKTVVEKVDFFNKKIVVEKLKNREDVVGK